MLNVLAFVLIGLQLRGIISRIEDGQWHTYALCAGAVCAAVIGIRFIWMPYNWFVRWRIRRYGMHGPRPMSQPTVGTGLLISWCGMRGIVTLAAALALPDGGPESSFPHRDLIVLCAFCVVLTTLVIQGATLGPLLKILGLQDDGSVQRELEIARVETARAALETLKDKRAARLSRDPQPRVRRSHAAGEWQAGEFGRAATAGRHLPAPQARRAEVRSHHRRRRAFHAAEEEIDLLELTADARIRPSTESDALAAEGDGKP